MGRLPFELEVRKPCRESWDGMTAASGGARHCARCDKAVHDLAGMTGREIERLVLRTRGELCARVTRRADGSMVMRPERMGAGLGSGFVLAGVLAGAPAVAQSEGKATAKVSGTVVLAPAMQKISPVAERQVMFIQDEKAVSTVTTDSQGRFDASIPPGNYDVVFRSGPMWGQRVKGVDFHAGEQEFSPVKERFNFGHLGEADYLGGDSVTVGEIVSSGSGLTLKKAVLHPLIAFKILSWKVRQRFHG